MHDLLNNPYAIVFFFILAYPWVPVLGILLLIAGVVWYVKKRKKNKKYNDIDLEIPPIRRKDIKVGYYSSLDRTFDQVKDHVNLFWSGFYGLDTWINVLKSGDMAFVMDLAGDLAIKEGKKFIAHPNREQQLRSTFQILRDAGVLHKLTYLYPIDEPQLGMRDAGEFLKIVQTVKKVRAEFEELNHTKLMTIYLKGQPFWCINEIDVVGVDAYEQKSESLTIGEHARLIKELAPGQKTVLVPGPGFGHNPDPWVAYAILHPHEVEVVAPFLWFDDPNHKDTDFTGLENQEAGFKQRWINAVQILQGKDGF